MPSAKSIYKFFFYCFTLGILNVNAQENSPYSRYGLGDLVPSYNISSAAMGGLSITNKSIQNINFSNPASYGQLSTNLNNGAYINFDIGLIIENRTLKQALPEGKFTTNNLIPSYLSFGLPLNKNKTFGAAIGLKPFSRINYSITTEGRFPASQVSTKDSFNSIYQGSGGLNQFFIGFGKSIGKDVISAGGKHNLKLGVNALVNFGKREANTNTFIVNDTVLHNASQHTSLTSYSGLGFELGGTWDINLKDVLSKDNKKTAVYVLTLGGVTTLKQNMSAMQEVERKTAYLDGSNLIGVIDSIYLQSAEGKVILPTKYSAGITFSRYSLAANGGATWSVGLQYETQQWGDQFKIMGFKDRVANSHVLRVGGEITPTYSSTNYFNLITYRAGFFTGTDYINADGKKLKITGVTAGFSFPIVSRRSSYSNQFTRINTAFEWGKRGSIVNNISENHFRFSIGLSLSDIWFIKRKYD